ncbi:MAG: hypothetical protein LAP39_00035 [Acidobacteriia bacterium]|nr:hypothetical protein [Terriglobia bacterium]
MSTQLPNHTHDAAIFTRAAQVQACPDLEQFLELLLGPGDAGSTFTSDESRRAAWRLHSEKLLRLVEPGSRPWGWWQYDAPEPALPRESDLDYLVRCGLFTRAECVRLLEARVQPAEHATRNP